jgi:sugar phosphate isomerase/epimerase
MEFGLCAWSFSPAHGPAGSAHDPMTVAGLIALAEERGLRSVEHSTAAFEHIDAEERERLVAHLRDSGLELVLDCPWTSEPSQIGTNVEHAMQLAREVGARAVRTTISHCLEGDRSRYGYQGWKDHLDALVKPLRRAADVAEDVDIPFGIENHQDLCSSELLWLLEQVGSSHCGVVMDCGNAFAVGEHPAAFAERVLPFLVHVQLKDYEVHPTPSGWRLVRCALGDGVVDWPDLVPRFDAGPRDVIGCIELGAPTARHVRLLERDWWETYEPRPWEGTLDAIRALHAASQPPGAEWRTPHERDEPPGPVAAYELAQFDASVEYLRRTFA